MARGVAPWLTIPGGIFGLFLTCVLVALPIVGDIAQTIFNGGLTFVFSGGLDRRDPSISWIEASAVTVLFLWATFSKWKSQPSPHRTAEV